MVEKSASSHFDLIYGESLLPVLQNLPKTTSATRDKPIRRPDTNTLNPHGPSKGRKLLGIEEEKKQPAASDQSDIS